MVDYSQIFKAAIERLHEEGRYRVFIDILRNKGGFPNARCFAGHNGPKPITRSDSFLTPSTLDQIFSISRMDRLAMSRSNGHA